MDYDSKLRKKDSLASRPREYRNALQESILQEQTPYLQRTAISKGTVQANLGGVLELRDSTGGTILLTADPETGTVTIGGPLQANVTLNLGTITNTTIAGAGTIAGTINNTRLINNGTWNNGTFGTADITGGTMRSGVLNAMTVGSPVVTSGTLTSSVVNAATLGTPAITGGTASGMLFTAGNITTGTVTNILDLSGITAGSANLKVTATTDTPTVVFAGGTFGPTTAPAGYIEILVGANVRYFPFWA